MSYLIYYLVPVAFLMVAFISWVVQRSTRARTGIDNVVLILLLVMMVAMLIGPAYLYLVTLGFTIGDVAIWEIAVFMSVGMMPIGVLLFAQYWMEGDDQRKGPLPLSNLLGHVRGLRATYILLLLLSELLMGWTFNLASGFISLTAGYSVASVENEFSYSVITPWFVFTMVGEMALTIFALRRTIRRDLMTVLGLQTAIMFLTPTAFSSRSWETYALFLEAAAMVGVVGFAIARLRGRGQRDGALLTYLALFIVANAVMMTGFLLWLVTGNTLLLALSLVAETVLYFDAVLTGSGFGATFGSAPPATSEPPPRLPSPAVPPVGRPELPGG
ncbi:MAG: hypothetical protein ABSF83_04260 [Nitrososphaerales archaeon]